MLCFTFQYVKFVCSLFNSYIPFVFSSLLHALSHKLFIFFIIFFYVFCIKHVRSNYCLHFMDVSITTPTHCFGWGILPRVILVILKNPTMILVMPYLLVAILGDCMLPIFDVINNILIVYNVILICLWLRFKYLSFKK